jgi:ankyrin repeat protein
LIDAGADVNATSYRDSPLMLAARTSEELVSLLLQAGADVDQVDPWGRTALHLAAEEGSEKSVTLLLEAGADPDRVDQYFFGGSTPLDYARRRTDQTGKQIVDLLAPPEEPAGETPGDAAP